MSLLNIKVPKLKFKKMKMDENVIKELENIDYENLEKKNIKNRNIPYEDATHYKTVKEFFLNSIKKYPNNPCILEKKEHKRRILQLHIRSMEKMLLVLEQHLSIY